MGLLGVQARGLIKHHPHCKGSPEEPHQGALFTVVLLHERGASGRNPSLSYAVGLGATHLSKTRPNFVSDLLTLAKMFDQQVGWASVLTFRAVT